jgi:hypothetical protein
MKFVRRTDLDSSTRLFIIAQALLAKGIYGKMTALARQYNISRTLLYRLLGQTYCYLSVLVSIENQDIVETPQIKALILLLRLEGQCSISSISEILQFMECSPHSTGTISQDLKHYGSQLPSTLQASSPHKVIYLSDEIFAISSPILVTIEPKSTAILKIELANNRTAETWEQHFDSLKKNRYIAHGLSSDRGHGIIAGFHQAYPDADWFSDHFHEFRGLTKICMQLERKAYTAIQNESDCLRLFNNACSENNLQKRLNNYDISIEKCEKSINRYEIANELLQWTRGALHFFNAKGEPQNQENIIQELLHIFSLFLELEYPPITEQIIILTGHLDEITSYFNYLNEIHKKISHLVPNEALPFICLSWQHLHFSHQTKSKLKHKHEDEFHFLLDCGISLLNIQEEKKEIEIIEQIFNHLNSIVRSSSLVEMVNSQIRPFLNSCKGQITQEMLNLIMFYHNHHKYKSGKRKNSAPIELLTGIKLTKHWLDLLSDQVS